MAILFRDTFTVGSSVDLIDHTPDTGGPWVYEAGVANNGARVLSTGFLRTNGSVATNVSYLDGTSVAGGYVRYTPLSGNQTAQNYIALRVQDADNFFGIYRTGSTSIVFSKVVAGVETVLYSGVGEFIAGRDYGLEDDGSVISFVEYDGATRVVKDTVTDSDFASATGKGVVVRTTVNSDMADAYESGTLDVVNTAPTVTITAPATGNVNTAFTATANGTDADGDTLTYTWSVVSGSATLSSTTGESIQVTPTATGTLEIGVVANDGTVDSSQATHTATISEALSDTIAIATTQFRMWAKNGSARDITITGTYTGTPTTIERSVDGGAFVTAIASPSGGTFSDTFSLAVGQHSITYRFSNLTAVNALVNNIAVGTLAVVAGQSNGSGRGTNNQTYADSSGGTTGYLLGNDDLWKQLVDPYDSNVNQVDTISSDSNAGGAWATRMANNWLANTNEPIGLIPCAKGGTVISQWAKGGSLYTSMARRIALAGGVSFVIFDQGESDANNTNATAGSVYRDALVQFANDVFADFGCPTYVRALHTITASGYDNQAVIRQAQIDADALTSNIILSSAMDDITLTGDGLHFQSDANLDIVATRMYQTIVGLVSDLTITISGVPDGTYLTRLFDNSNNVVYNNTLAFTSGSATLVDLDLPVGASVEGFVIDNQTTHVNGAVITGTTV